MTDRDKLKKLFNEFGVGFQEKEGDVYCEWGKEKIEGQISSYTFFTFDNDGSFVEMGAAER